MRVTKNPSAWEDAQEREDTFALTIIGVLVTSKLAGADGLPILREENAALETVSARRNGAQVSAAAWAELKPYKPKRVAQTDFSRSGTNHAPSLAGSLPFEGTTADAFRRELCRQFCREYFAGISVTVRARYVSSW